VRFRENLAMKVTERDGRPSPFYGGLAPSVCELFVIVAGKFATTLMPQLVLNR
jgi:hypothetical protein